jgi:hypothetical protein
MKYIRADIRTVQDGYIFQQCNCVTLKPHGLAESLEASFPGTCPYQYRKAARTETDTLSRNVATLESRANPGTVFILSNGASPNIVNMFAQYAPGKAGNSWQPLIDVDGKITVPDDANDREKYFQHCLDAMLDFFEFTEGKVKVAIPYKIGCGLAGGNWSNYERMLEEFEKRMLAGNIDLEMTIYQL